MERLTRRINGVVVYVGAKNPYSTGQIPCEVEPAGVREMMDRLAAYEDTRLTPERCAEFARADAEGRCIIMRDAEQEQEGVARLRELAEADKEGRLFLLPTEPGRPMLCREYFERPWVMKNVTLCVQYQSSAGIIFYMGYDVFRGLVECGRITPLSQEGEEMLEGKANV